MLENIPANYQVETFLVEIVGLNVTQNFLFETLILFELFRGNIDADDICVGWQGYVGARSASRFKHN